MAYHIIDILCTDDGSVRVYNQETSKVVKAIRGLGEVSSIISISHNAGGFGGIWVASNRHVCPGEFGIPHVSDEQLHRLYILLWTRKR